MPYSETHTYSISVTVPKGVTLSQGVPSVNGSSVVEITATDATQAGAAALLVTGMQQLAAALNAEGIAPPAP